jgi:phage replication-related protein YjqB (UPF0714/DUF867 family)
MISEYTSQSEKEFYSMQLFNSLTELRQGSFHNIAIHFDEQLRRKEYNIKRQPW